jgi:biotin operon repressor
MSHKEKIAKYLTKKEQTIRQLSSLLSIKENAVRSRVAELRQDGMSIETITTKSGKTAYKMS